MDRGARTVRRNHGEDKGLRDWYEDRYGEPPKDMSAADEYLADTGRAFTALNKRLKSDSKEPRVSDSTFDVFISHASEDKDIFVRPLFAELAKRQIRVLYDEPK